VNVLLLTSHSIAEYDDLRMLTDLGYRTFSIGAYTDPANPGDDKRPALPDAPYYSDLARLVEESREGRADPGPLIDWAKAELHPDLIDWADAIICHHFPAEWIARQWTRIRHKRVIWRTCGQSNPALEGLMRGFRYEDLLEIVRYSPAERRFFEPLGTWAGQDAVIRFGKYPGDYPEWTGTERTVLNVTQGLIQRGEHTHWDFWEDATSGLPRMPIGPGSEAIGGAGSVPYDAMLAWLARGRAYLYTGTQPASYTLGLMEAMFAGIPTLSIGPAAMWAPDLFEGHEITRLWADDPGMAKRKLRDLLDDWDYARAMGADQRQRAIDLFGIETVGAQWREFLGAPA
jgi:hypothetical protein